jgi:hypothetical protein
LREAFLLTFVWHGSILVFTGKGKKGGGREPKIIRHYIVVVQAFPPGKKLRCNNKYQLGDEIHITLHKEPIFMI